VVVNFWLALASLDPRFSSRTVNVCAAITVFSRSERTSGLNWYSPEAHTTRTQ
jgi:hypothetical protein